jgi:hypothetical protein
MVVLKPFLFRRIARAGPAIPAPAMRMCVCGDIVKKELSCGILGDTL